MEALAKGRTSEAIQELMGLQPKTARVVRAGEETELPLGEVLLGDALQTLQEAEVVALDKTGTLTEGRPKLTDLVAREGFDESDVLQLTAAVEHRSEHPIARAIVEAAGDENLPLLDAVDFESVAGFGVNAIVDGRHVAVGADRYMVRLGHDPRVFAEEAARMAGEGKTPFYVAVDGELAAVLAVSDPIKASTPQAIRALQGLGLRVAMITGDNERCSRPARASPGARARRPAHHARACVEPQACVTHVDALVRFRSLSSLGRPH